jgi:hypothetical protein
VGNSPVLLDGETYGDEIDSHQLVMRINNAPTVGFEKYAGSKTNLRYQNERYMGYREFPSDVLLGRYVLCPSRVWSQSERSAFAQLKFPRATQPCVAHCITHHASLVHCITPICICGPGSATGSTRCRTTPARSRPRATSSTIVRTPKATKAACCLRCCTTKSTLSTTTSISGSLDRSGTRTLSRLLSRPGLHVYDAKVWAFKGHFLSYSSDSQLSHRCV